MRLIFLLFSLLLSPLEIMSIFNGQEAAINDFSYQVAINIRSKEQRKWCGGALLSKDWIITVAHCVREGKQIIAFMGVCIDTDKSIKFTKIDRENVTMHEDFDMKLLKNDIALLKMSKPMELTDKIKPVLLPPKNASGAYSDYENEKLFTSGWGLLSDESTDPSNNLEYMMSRVLQPQTCEKAFDVDMENRICTMGQAAAAPCHGDSGDPMVLRDGDKRYLIGLASFGAKGECQQTEPFVFTRITSYIEWIQKHTGSLPQVD